VITEHGCKIAHNTYYAFTTRAPSARSVCDEARLVQVRRVFAASGNRYGADKVWWQLHKEGSVVAGGTVERLIRGKEWSVSTPGSGTPTASPSWGYWPPSGASGTASTTLVPKAR